MNGKNEPIFLRLGETTQGIPVLVAYERNAGSFAMRILLFGLAVFVVTGGICTRAEALNYPWCAYYDGGRGGGGTNCGFTTYQQCMATVSGIGGFCERNTQYVPPAGLPAPRHRHKPYPPS